jgi:hypothetical protein
MSNNKSEKPPVSNSLAPEPGQRPENADAVGFLEAQLSESMPNMPPELRQSLARLGAGIARRSVEQAQRSAPQKPKTADIIQLSFWGEDYRAAPNAIFRSALFPALNGRQKENRRFLDNEEVFCVAGLEIFFTGKQFDQSDLDVYLEILNMARHFPLGTPVQFSAHSLLKALGLTTGGENHARLHSVLIRLCGGVADITDHGQRYFGQLLHGGIRDEISMNYSITVNPDFAVLFGFGMYAKVDLSIRRALGRNPTAKALHAYYSSHINPGAHNFDTLAKIAGVTGKNQKATLLKAHAAMKEAGFLAGYELTGNAIKPIIDNHTPSQNRAILKKAAKTSKASPRQNKPTLVGDLLPPPPTKKK